MSASDTPVGVAAQAIMSTRWGWGLPEFEMFDQLEADQKWDEALREADRVVSELAHRGFLVRASTIVDGMAVKAGQRGW